MKLEIKSFVSEYDNRKPIIIEFQTAFRMTNAELMEWNKVFYGNGKKDWKAISNLFKEKLIENKNKIIIKTEL